MIVAVISDVHANLEALSAALAEAERRGATEIVNLGDVVGYGPDPEACVDLVRAECAVSVLGNHDAAVAHAEGLDVLPRDGRAAAVLHRERLRPDQLEWLAGLPLTATRHDATFVHASPHRPEAWTRLESFAQIREQFAAFETPLCFVGHSHRPAVVSESVGVFRVRPGHRFLVDVGSVGQPRDRDARLAFALYDTEAVTVEVVRLNYDHSVTSRKIAAVGLPARLGERLSTGR